MSIAIWIVVAVSCCGWLLVVGRAIRDLLQPAKEDQWTR